MDRQCVRTWLLKNADEITYSARGCDGALAKTEKLPLDSSEKAMGRSLICISRSEHYNPLRGELPAAERNIRQFNLAVALLHELAHAISYAITARQEEDFFEDSIVGSLGQVAFCWEERERSRAMTLQTYAVTRASLTKAF
jgi:hypothetical protein